MPSTAASRLPAATPAPKRMRLLSGSDWFIPVAISFLFDHQHADSVAVDRRRLRNRRQTRALVRRHRGEAILPDQKILIARLRDALKFVRETDLMIGIEREIAIEHSDVVDGISHR